MRIRALILCATLFGAPSALAWEGATTHAGLTEQAALASGLHRALVHRFGLALGLYDELTVPPTDSREFWQTLTTLLCPSQTYTPDTRGKMSALGWLVAGSVLGDVPRQNAANHFYNPATGRGMSDRTLDERKRPLGDRVFATVVREAPPNRGVAALRWIRDGKNPNGLPVFYRHLLSAVTERKPAERQRHLARALYSAGVILHILSDMGSPSHVRDDLGAHYDTLGPDPLDVGSRFERVAALAFGRLGVPAPAAVERRAAIEDYFVTEKQTGLADLTYAGWFSAYTLPRSFAPPRDSTPVIEALQRHLRYPQPGPHIQLRAGESKLVNREGTCLADVNTTAGRYAFSLSDECALEQLGKILPQVGAYGAGLIDTMFGEELEISLSASEITVVNARTGRLTMFWDDKNGVRTRYETTDVTTAGLVRVPRPPVAAVAVIALYESKEGQRIAIGRVALGDSP